MAKIFDPTKNVNALAKAIRQEQKNALKAEAKRQDDLRKQGLKNIAHDIKQRAQFGRMLYKTHAMYEEKLATGEKSRVDALLLANATEQRNANQRAIELAAGLATQVTTTAETLSAKQTEFEERINKRMTDVENFQQQDVGKSKIIDPQMEHFMADMREAMKGVNKTEGKSEGIRVSWSVLVSVILIAIAFGTMIYTRPASPPQQVMYAPTPPTK